MDHNKYLKLFEEHNPNEITKVILATKVAETSLAFNDISMVIDAGLNKDSVCNSLTGVDEVHYMNISKSSAQQRAAMTGKTRPGICYRIYSEEKYQNFVNERQVPELSKRNIEKGIFMLKQLGVEDIGNFEFLDKIPSQIIESSEERLVGYKALTGTEKTITDAGSKMWKINLAPFFSKPLFKALKLGVFHEVAKIISILKYASTLYNVGEGEEMLKQKQTQLWKQFSSHKDYEGVEGDHFLYLFIFDEFLKYHEKSPDENGEESKIEMDASKQANSAKKWCKHHGLSYSTLKNAYGIYTELAQNFASEIERAKVSETQRTKTDRILEVLFKSHLLNFCVHSNVDPLGYLFSRESTKLENIIIHPNSIYSGNSKQPPFIIFSQLQDSGDLIASSVTGFSAQSLTFFTNFPKICKHLEVLAKSIPGQLIPLTFDGLGSAVLNEFKDKMGELHSWRSNNKVFFKINEKTGSISVWSDPATESQNIIFIKQMLEKIKRELENEKCEIGFYKDSRVVLKKNVTIDTVHKGAETTTLITSELDEFITAEDIGASIKEKYGEAITPQVKMNFDQISQTKNAVISVENAKLAEELSNKKLDLKGRQIELKKRHVSQEVDFDRAVGVQVFWYAGCSKGIGVITPFRVGEATIIADLFAGAQILENNIKAVRQENAITLSPLPVAADEIYLRDFLLEKSSIIHRPDIHVRRQKSQSQEIEYEKAQVEQFLFQKSQALNGEFGGYVQLQTYKFIYTYVFENAKAAFSFIKEIDKMQIPIKTLKGKKIKKMIHAYPLTDWIIDIPTSYNKKYQEELKEFAKSLNIKYNKIARISFPETEIKANNAKKEFHKVFIHTLSPIHSIESLMKSVVQIKEEFSRKMMGTQILSLLDHKFYSLLFTDTPDVANLISAAIDPELQIIMNQKDRTLFLQGDLAKIRASESSLREALDKNPGKYLVEEIDVTPFDTNFLLNGGLEPLRRYHTSVYISLKIKKGYLSVECLSQDKEALKKVKGDVLLIFVQKIQKDKTNCSLCNHKSTRGARILNCGHSYCFKCIRFYLQELCRRKERNWSCFQKDCQEGIIVRDIVNVLSQEDLKEYLKTVNAQEYQQTNVIIQEDNQDEIMIQENENKVSQGIAGLLEEYTKEKKEKIYVKKVKKNV